MTATAALVRRAQAGDRDAFELLWSEHRPSVERIALAAAPHLVDDVTQEVAVAALGSIASLRQGQRVGAWIRQITRNVVADVTSPKRAWQKRDRDREERQIGPQDPAPTPEPHVGAAARAVVAVIATLPPTYARVLRLSLVDGLTGPEIAAALGMTQGSVRVNLCRGRKLLRAALDTPFDGEGSRTPGHPCAAPLSEHTRSAATYTPGIPCRAVPSSSKPNHERAAELLDKRAGGADRPARRQGTSVPAAGTARAGGNDGAE